ncbi:MAG: zinc ribbon domain-containing protein [Spirochaetaceae bacterium]|jgi:putative FmdB family regulatory protein|nr:zinc ribbon domain-containing protein [Spirochaetaceae bacterium]
MPTYEYECKKCDHVFERFQSFKDDPVTVCPECGGDVRRLINGGAGIIYKGSGFYSTDKASGKPAAKDGKKSDSGDKTAGGTASPCASCPHSGGDSPCAEKAAG